MGVTPDSYTDTFGTYRKAHELARAMSPAQAGAVHWAYDTQLVLLTLKLEY